MATPFNTPEHMEAGKIMMPVAAADQKNIAYGLSVFGGNRVWTIGAKTHYPELCMEIINWFCTPEGILTYCYGPQGVTWDRDEHGNTYLTELGLQCQEDKKNTKVTYGDYTGSYQDGEFQHNNTTFTRDAVNPLSAAGETYDYRFWASTLQNKTVYPIEQTWRDYTGYSKADAYLEGNGYLSVSIGSSFTNGTRDNEFETTWTQVKQAIRSGSWKAIYAKSDSEYDFVVSQMIQNAKAYGYDQCVQWCQEQALLRKEAEDMAKR
jgi:multiple sugar transport system substrate-binding protein/putative aldouronate transport system substrate-binding protein